SSASRSKRSKTGVRGPPPSAAPAATTTASHAVTSVHRYWAGPVVPRRTSVAGCSSPSVSLPTEPYVVALIEYVGSLFDVESGLLLVACLLDLRGERLHEHRPGLGGLPAGVLVRLGRATEVVGHLFRPHPAGHLAGEALAGPVRDRQGREVLLQQLGAEFQFHVQVAAQCANPVDVGLQLRRAGQVRLQFVHALTHGLLLSCGWVSCTARTSPSITPGGGSSRSRSGSGGGSITRVLPAIRSWTVSAASAATARATVASHAAATATRQASRTVVRASHSPTRVARSA